MSIVVRTNTSSIMAQRHLSRTNQAMQGNIAKLSSGYRINSAADDAAGLAISEGMKSDIRSLGQASRNAMDGISVIQTAEGALDQVHNILGRMRELGVQANSDILTAPQRKNLNAEFSQLKNELNDISDRTTFNGTSLLNSTSNASISFQVGIAGTEKFGIRRGASTISTAALTDVAATALGLAGGLSTVACASGMLGKIDSAITRVSNVRANLGALQNRIDSKVQHLSLHRQNLEGANSRIRDVDVANEMASMTKNQILMQAGVSMLAQANSSPQVALGLLG